MEPAVSEMILYPSANHKDLGERSENLCGSLLSNAGITGENSFLRDWALKQSSEPGGHALQYFVRWFMLRPSDVVA